MESHHEHHFTARLTVRDIAIGAADGLTVPFALAAGLVGAASSSKLVVVAGLAEIAAGSIAMGLGGYLAARSDADHYARERQREQDEVLEKPHAERAEVAAIFRHYGLAEDQIEPILRSFEKNEPAWIDFMMRFELGLERPDPHRSVYSALTIGLAYIAGGLVPLSPYLLLSSAALALKVSAAATLAALLAFGYAKGRVTSGHPWRAALNTACVGGCAAAAAFFLARLVAS